MKFRSFELMDWVAEHHHNVKYDLGSSGISAVKLSELKVNLHDIDLGDTYVGGRPELRKTVAELYNKKEDNVIITDGASEANFLVFTTLLNAGDEAIIENPTYASMLEIPRGLGAKIKRIQRDRNNNFDIDLARLEDIASKKTKLIVLTNLNNPTSAILSGKKLAAINSLARDCGALVMVDEIYRDAAFEHTPPSACTLSDRFVVTSSTTKTYGIGGLRIGWVAASEDIIKKVRRVKVYTSVCSSPISEILTMYGIKNRKKFLDRTKKIVKKNIKIVGEWAENNDNIKMYDPGFGIVRFPRLNEIDPKKLAMHLLKKYNTLISPGVYFGMKQYFRIGLGMDEKILRAGLENINRAINELKRR
jgi:aspartate/methionine/tyrosine aminotransferase